MIGWTDYSANPAQTTHNSKVNRNTWAFTGLIAISLSGCGSPQPVAKTPAAPPIRFAGKVTPPESLAPTDLALFSETGRLRVGDSLDEATRVFPSPHGMVGPKELPPGFGQEFRARGFESREEGLGLILMDNRVALALRRLENRAFPEVQDLVAEFKVSFGEAQESVAGARIEYRFWEIEDQRLMLCTAPDKNDPTRFDITMAVGPINLMDALRMSYPAAREDRAVAERTLPGLRHPG